MLAISNEWGLIIPSVADGTQPTTSYGTSVTPGTSNAYGSYASLLAGASLTSDCYLLEVICTNAFSTGVDRGMLVTIGFDPAGGTSFGGLGGVTGNEISHLMCSGASYWYANNDFGGGHRWRFPIFVKAGTSIGAKAQTNDGTAGTVHVAVVAYCKPSRPELMRVGSYVRTYGITTASTSGTAITDGTASEGSWTEIGTSADAIWYVETSLAMKTNAGVDHVTHADVGIGDASNKRVIAHNIHGLSDTSERFKKFGIAGQYATVASGQKFYGRAQSSGALTGLQMACHGVGG